MPPVISEPNRFNIPVMEFMTQILGEAFPDLNVAEGSVLHDTMVRPVSLMLQPHRDFSRLLARNLSLRNFQVMDEAELDRLSANFLVQRRAGVRARGVQRVFFQSPQPVSIGPEARFFDDQGRAFSPVNTVAVSQSDLEANVVPATGEFYVDVPVVAAIAGEEGMVAAGTVRNVQGIPGATRTTNEKGFTAGKNRDSNTELYNRILGSVTNRDLVKRNAIEKAILDSFDSVRRVEVVGFGDADMQRDVVSVAIAVQELFQRSFCQKVNLPLDGEGNIKFVEDDGVTVVQVPVGGFVGGIVDNMAVDFLAMQVTLDGRVFETVAVQPGFRVRLFGEDASDPDTADFTVTRVVDGPIAPGGQNVRIAMVDRPFNNLTQPMDPEDRFPYTVVGATNTDRFHVGGKVDVYVDSTANAEKEVTITTLLTDTDGVAEVPVTATAELPAGGSLFEEGIGFETPVLALVKVEEVDPVATDVVLRTLVPDLHYVLVRQEKRGRFSLAENDAIIIRGRDENDVALFNGSRIKVTYLTNADFEAIQEFVDLPGNRDVTKDILVKSPEVVQLDVDFSYRGTRALSEVKDIVTEFIAEKSFRPEVTVNEVVSLLAFFGVTDIVMPVTLTSRFDRGDGEVDVSSDQDRLSAGRVQVFRAVPDLSIRKIG